MNEVIYKPQFPHHSRLAPSIHIFYLKPVMPGPLPEGTPPPASLDINGEPVYTIK